MARLFGTDGVRGLANRQITAQLALELGEAAARALAQGGEGRPRAVVARDTRLSGAMLAQAVAAGLAGAGATSNKSGHDSSPVRERSLL